MIDSIDLKNKRVLALIDGEHYPEVTASALLQLMNQGATIKICGFLGGTEKIRTGSVPEVGVRVVEVGSPGALKDLIKRHRVNMVIDLSDVPVVNIVDRIKMAGAALGCGADYLLADTLFFADRSTLVKVGGPAIAVVGTGKRVGKTAIAGHLAAALRKTGFDPMLIAMGRGGPAGPVLISSNEKIDLQTLINASRSGKHAASDHFEDAFLTSVSVLGTRRCGGGLFGRPFISNMRAAQKILRTAQEDIFIFEGSGSCVPQVRADMNILVTSVSIPRTDSLMRTYPELKRSSLLTSRLADPFQLIKYGIADILIITGCEPPFAKEREITEIEELAREMNPNVCIIRAVFRPEPTVSIKSKNLFIATTMPPVGNPLISAYLKNKFGCRSVVISNFLSDRERLLQDLSSGASSADIILTEIKAAAIDVVAEFAIENKIKIGFMNNLPLTAVGQNPIMVQIMPLIKKLMQH